MKKEDLRLHSIEELQNKITDARNELMNLRFQMVAGQLTEPDTVEDHPPSDCPPGDHTREKNKWQPRKVKHERTTSNDWVSSSAIR